MRVVDDLKMPGKMKNETLTYYGFLEALARVAYHSTAIPDQSVSATHVDQALSIYSDN